MQLGGQRASGNVFDRRGMAIGGGVGIGGVIVALIAMFLGVDPGTAINMGTNIGSGAQVQQKEGPQGAPADEGGQFTAKVLGSTEDVWQQIFKAEGARYKEPKLVLYEGGTRTACGTGQAAMGPFYCPLDEALYIDLGFFRDLQTKFKAPGDFAAAYVIAHEVGHHIQKVTGTMDKLHQLRGRVSQTQYNQAQVRLELQADCYAGVWAHHAGNRKLLDPGDVEEGLAAAAAVGDDRLQKQGRGYVVPESFTHGSSAQRSRWFKRGLESGQVGACDTFNAKAL